MNNYKHWQLNIDQENIAWLGFDRADAEVNVIDELVLDELNGLLHEITHSPELKGLVIYSLKEKGFIAGADVHAFSTFKTSSEAISFLRKGQMVFARIENLSIPSVAMIHGFCLGGGLELALACRYRIASEEKGTVLGLPEIKLGIHPGWGGTVRLPRLIGGFHALSQVILTGSALSAARAKQLGLVDDVVPLRQLKRAVVYFIEHLPKPHQPSLLQALSNYTWVRRILSPLLARQIEKVAKKTHYPAPYAVLDLWEKEGASGERAYLKEVDSVEQLVRESATAKELIRVFLLHERLKGFSKAVSFKAKSVHVIGAGTMGGDIAAWCALQGLKVTLQDQSYEKIAPALGRAYILFKKKLIRSNLVQAAFDRLIPDVDGHGIARADVIIEAVFENLALKQGLMKMLEETAKKDALIATNTSSIPLEKVAEAMKAPERLIGIHFFNPVSRMELVEVVKGEASSTEICQKACAFVGQISRLPLPVRSSPGFLINRVLMPYLLAAMQLYDEGYSIEEIDAAAENFGMVMGPIALVDTVGLDICLAVAENLSQHFDVKVPPLLKKMVEEGKLGRKSGRGFYRYKQGKPVKQKQKDLLVDENLSNRLILPMIQEAERCLREKVVTDSDLVDAGMIFATGFAPFRGGPLHYAKEAEFVEDI